VSQDSEVAVSALRSEIRQAIEDIRDRRGTDTCLAHEALARGVIVLLRCQDAALHAVQRQLVWTGAFASVVAALVAVVVRCWP